MKFRLSNSDMVIIIRKTSSWLQESFSFFFFFYLLTGNNVRSLAQLFYQPHNGNSIYLKLRDSVNLTSSCILKESEGPILWKGCGIRGRLKVESLVDRIREETTVSLLPELFSYP